jgi:hypothetical protein
MIFLKVKTGLVIYGVVLVLYYFGGPEGPMENTQKRKEKQNGEPEPSFFLAIVSFFFFFLPPMNTGS